MYKVQALYGPSSPISADSDSQAYGINSYGDVAGIGWPLTLEPGVPFPVPNLTGWDQSGSAEA